MPGEGRDRLRMGVVMPFTYLVRETVVTIVTTPHDLTGTSYERSGVIRLSHGVDFGWAERIDQHTEVWRIIIPTTDHEEATT